MASISCGILLQPVLKKKHVTIHFIDYNDKSYKAFTFVWNSLITCHVWAVVQAHQLLSYFNTSFFTFGPSAKAVSR